MQAHCSQSFRLWFLKPCHGLHGELEDSGMLFCHTQSLIMLAFHPKIRCTVTAVTNSVSDLRVSFFEWCQGRAVAVPRRPEPAAVDQHVTYEPSFCRRLCMTTCAGSPRRIHHYDVECPSWFLGSVMAQ